jgi:hypothetical protein
VRTGRASGLGVRPAAAGLGLLAVVLLATGCSSIPPGRKQDLISGRIFTEKDGIRLPVGQAQLTIRPIHGIRDAWKPDVAPEEPTALRAVAISNGSGYFQISALSSDQTYDEYRLLRRWDYEITIRIPGYSIYEGKFPFLAGPQELSVALEEKGADAPDGPGVIEIDEKALMQWGVGGPAEVLRDQRTRDKSSRELRGERPPPDGDAH